MFIAIKWSFLADITRKCVMVELWYILFINFTLFFFLFGGTDIVLFYFTIYFYTFDLSPMRMLAWQHAHNDSEEGSSAQPYVHVVISVCAASPN